MKKKIDKKRLNVVLNGGLGNQLFIYSAAKKFAKKKKIKNIFFFQNKINPIRKINNKIPGKKVKLLIIVNGKILAINSIFIESKLTRLTVKSLL